MADTNKVVAVEVPRQDQPAEGVKADTPNPDLVHGIPKKEYEALDYPAQMRVQMRDVHSDLRNQVTNEDTANYQLLSNTNAFTIAAMTSLTIPELKQRADKLNVTLKGSLAGDQTPTPQPASHS